MLKSKADYKEIEKEVNKRIEKRNKDKSNIEAEIEKEKASLEAAKDNKQKMLETGTKEEYLSACEKVVRIENALEYLNAKEIQLKKSYKVTKADLEKVKKAIVKEQDRVTREGLREIKEALEKVLGLCNDVLSEQKTGDSIYKALLDSFKADSSEEEIGELMATSKLLEENYKNTYGLNFIGSLKGETEKLYTRNYNKDVVKQFLNGNEE